MAVAVTVTVEVATTNAVTGQARRSSRGPGEATKKKGWKNDGKKLENHGTIWKIFKKNHWKFMKKAMEITILSSVSLAKSTNELNGEH